MSTTTRRPLADLPIHNFKPTSLKRPLNPNLLLSPSKRRVLEADPFSLSPADPKRIAVRLSGSPRKLDFSEHNQNSPTTVSSFGAGGLVESHGDIFATPRPKTKSFLTPSPEITPKQPDKKLKEPVRKRDSSEGDDNPFLDRARAGVDPASPFSTATSAIPYFLDRTSPHYPGFDVHCSSRLVMSLPTNPTVMEDKTRSEDENIPPCPKTKKSVTAPLALPSTSRPKLSSEEISHRRKSEPAGSLKFLRPAMQLPSTPLQRQIKVPSV